MMFPESYLTLTVRLAAIAVVLLMQLAVFSGSTLAQAATAPFHGALLSASQVTAFRLSQLKSAGANAVVLPIASSAAADAARAFENSACEQIRDVGRALSFRVEIARCPELSDAKPDGMASLQRQTEWLRLFTRPPAAGNKEVVKTYSWVPILNEEPFAGQLARVKLLLWNRPATAGIFLNDIQGSPSACGCGRHLCRRTSDYGKLRTTTS